MKFKYTPAQVRHALIAVATFVTMLIASGVLTGTVALVAMAAIGALGTYGIYAKPNAPLDK